MWFTEEILSRKRMLGIQKGEEEEVSKLIFLTQYHEFFTELVSSSGKKARRFVPHGKSYI